MKGVFFKTSLFYFMFGVLVVWCLCGFCRSTCANEQVYAALPLLKCLCCAAECRVSCVCVPINLFVNNKISNLSVCFSLP